jgi:hypothetical protein
MSSISIAGDTSGSIILQAPAVSGSTTLTLPTTTGTLVTSNAMPTGSVLQVVQSTLTSQVSSTATSYTNIGLSASITPSSTSSKILVICQVPTSTGGNAGSFLQIFRNGTAVAQGDANGSRQRTFSQSMYTSAVNSGVQISMNYLDSPASSSSVTYDIRAANLEDSTAWYINRSANNFNGSYGYTSISTLVLMEIKG